MVDALRAALRLLPAARSGLVACPRASLRRCHTPTEQSALLNLPAQSQFANCEPKRHLAGTGIARFAKAVLSYVGAGISTIAVAQFSGPGIVHAKELGATVEVMAGAELRAAWQRTAATYYLLHEDAKRPNLPQSAAHEQKSDGQSMKGVDCVRSLGFSEAWTSLNSQYFAAPKSTIQETEKKSEHISDTCRSLHATVGSGSDISPAVQSDMTGKQSPSSILGKVSSENRPRPSIKMLDVAEGPESRVAASSGYGSLELDSITSSTCEKAYKQSADLNSFTTIQSGSLSWRTAGKEDLAALVAQKSLERVENCDLPPVHALGPKDILGKCDVISKKGDSLSVSQNRSLLASLLSGKEPAHLDMQGLPTTDFVLGAGRLSVSPSYSSMPSSTIAYECHHISSTNNETPVQKRADDPHFELCQALCHSQTRAREAEKVAAVALLEKERLMNLFLKEASISFTYKQWVNFLQAENLCLRLHAGDQSPVWVQHNFLNPQIAFQQLSNNRWKAFVKKKSLKWDKDRNYQHESSYLAPDMMLGCTVGLAFALGLSLASAGFMLGCGMGWILLDI